MGAMPFLRGLRDEGRLVSYLQRCTASMRLDTATSVSLKSIEKMNSMLTKVHALLSDDGLPIYDSRVAGSAAALVEMFRLESGISDTPQADLLFPSVGGATRKRQVTACFRMRRGTRQSVIWTIRSIRSDGLTQRFVLAVSWSLCFIKTRPFFNAREPSRKGRELLKPASSWLDMT